MPVKVKCTTCDKVLSVPDAARGKAVKCPQCDTRISVPAEDDSDSSSSSSRPRPKSTTSKPKPKKATQVIDSEEGLGNLDLRRAEDTEARICPKCGFDMQYHDEEDSECPECGYDTTAGGLGVRAKKRAMKGPDPADFYPGLVKEAWKFVGRNIFLAWRTVLYTLVCLAIALSCAFLYLWISMWPPRAFLALCFTISFLVIPGWMWFLDTEVIKLTLERKDKFKKLNFDFFLASAMGGAFIFWSIVVLLPLVALPAGLGYLLVNYSGMPSFVLPLCVGIGSIPAVWMLPVVMSHMSMPVQYKGWMVWKMVPVWLKNLKPLSVWILWFLITNIPNIAGVATIAAVSGEEISGIVNIMEENARIERIKFQRIQNPNTQKKGQKAPVLEPLPDTRSVNLKPLILPCVILAVMALINGFTSLFNMRTNGQFTYYNKASLELVDKLKEYKYKAKEKRDEDEDDKPKTLVQQGVDGFVFVMVFGLVGLVGGMLYGSFTDAGTTKGIVGGMLIGMILSWIVAHINGIKDGYQDSAMWGSLNLIPIIPGFIFVSKNWEYRQTLFFQYLFSILSVIGMIIAAFAVEVLPIRYSESAAAPAGGAPAAGAPGGMQNQMMPGQMGPPGGAPGGPPGGAPGQMMAPGQPPSGMPN